jgi:hypothetical protein
MATGDAEGSPSVAVQTTGQRIKAFFGGAAFKTGCFVCIIILIAVLSATVLQKPIAEGSAWVRKSGVGGYFLLASIGYVFLVLGGSSSLFDIICGYIYGVVNGELLPIFIDPYIHLPIHICIYPSIHACISSHHTRLS